MAFTVRLTTGAIIGGHIYNIAWSEFPMIVDTVRDVGTMEFTFDWPDNVVRDVLTHRTPDDWLSAWEFADYLRADNVCRRLCASASTSRYTIESTDLAKLVELVLRTNDDDLWGLVPQVLYCQSGAGITDGRIYTGLKYISRLGADDMRAFLARCERQISILMLTVLLINCLRANINSVEHKQVIAICIGFLGRRGMIPTAFRDLPEVQADPLLKEAAGRIRGYDLFADDACTIRRLCEVHP